VPGLAAAGALAVVRVDDSMAGYARAARIAGRPVTDAVVCDHGPRNELRCRLRGGAPRVDVRAAEAGTLHAHAWPRLPAYGACTPRGGCRLPTPSLYTLSGV